LWQPIASDLASAQATVTSEYLDVSRKIKLPPHLELTNAVNELPHSNGEYIEFDRRRQLLTWSALEHLYGFAALGDLSESKLVAMDYVAHRGALTQMQLEARSPALIAKFNDLSGALYKLIDAMDAHGSSLKSLGFHRHQARLDIEVEATLARVAHYQSIKQGRGGDVLLDLAWVQSKVPPRPQFPGSEATREQVMKAAKELHTQLAHWHPDCARALVKIFEEPLEDLSRH
jgi:hypothetical protein